ncbi:MAG TPA: bifunctional DNA primase/polymerase [Acidimicrobiales bacterium]|nr:bifunctional DNA primase/polymerase [Acidimicrobiales bacterium]
MSAQALAALDYARRGWRVFPCHAPGRGGPCTCGARDCASPAKHPRTRHGLHDASTDPTQVAAWWRRWPAGNVGIRTGDGVVVLDVDPAHGGARSLADLEAAHGRLPATAVVRTGGAGLHLYFACTEPLRNSAGALGPGLDVRGEGGYIIAPPSWHTSGAPYRWSARGPLAPLPDWVLGALVRPEPERRQLDPASLRVGPGTGAWAAAALDGEARRVAAAAVGQRNHTLNRSAFVLGQLVGAGHLDAGEVTAVLHQAAGAAGLGEREAAATVASGLAAGERLPRHPAPRPAGRGPVDLRTVELPGAGRPPPGLCSAADGLMP